MAATDWYRPELGVELAARTLLAHRDAAIDIAVSPAAKGPTDLSEGYRIQAALERILVVERGFEPIGYKIAVTNAAHQQYLKISSPFFGRLFRQWSSRSPAALPSRPNLWRLHEPEIALRLGQDLDPAGAPYDAAAVARSTAAVLPAIEVAGTPFTPWTAAGAANLVADDAAHGHWIMGVEMADFAGLDLLNAPVALIVDGTVRATGRGRNVDGGAFGATAWLANALIGMGRWLRAGDYVTTGSVAEPCVVSPGQSVLADFGALGRVEVRVGSPRR
jgi:2-keto-4-pentenoate hydratase